MSMYFYSLFWKAVEH